MSKVTDNFQQVLTNWESLKKARPLEFDFSGFGSALSYADVDEFLARINSIILAIDSKGYWLSSPELAVAEAPIITAILALNKNIMNGRAHGVAVMFNGGFLTSLNNVRQLISSASARQVSLNKEVAKKLLERSEVKVDAILKASETASQINELGIESKNLSEKISAYSSDAELALNSVNSAKIGVKDASDFVQELSEKAAGRLAEIELADEIVGKIRIDVQARESALKKALDEADKKVAQTKEDADFAIESVRKALKQVRDQGLAAAFQGRSTSMKCERNVWGGLFLISIGALIYLGTKFAADLETFTYEQLIVAILRKVGISAPAVWLGWYAARQLGRVSKVQQDYEYKAASALAYQSYRDEVSALGNDILLERLADIAITNFGSNPVRLYEDGNNESVSPVQELVGKMQKGKEVALLADLSRVADKN